MTTDSRLLCGCDCGQLLNPIFVRASAMRETGLTHQRIASRLDTNRGYVKAILNRPPRFVKGHHINSVDRGLYSRPCVGCGGPVGHGGETPYCWRKSCPGAALRQEWKHQRWVDRDEEIAWREHERRQAALLRRAERGLDEKQSRLAREEDKGTIEHLRNLVGIGWRRDSDGFGYGVLSLEGLGERYGNFDRVPVKASYEHEEYLERRAAGLLLDFGDLLTDKGLVGRALEHPEGLTPAERETLRAVFEDAESMVITGRVSPRHQLPALEERVAW